MSGISPSSLYNAPSPSSSTSSQPTPSRKRQRPNDSITSEERKEARAERNRIAAQISRDRRKAEFDELKHKVAFLERENATLRATIATTGIASPSTAALAITQRELERERENKELKERVKMLEKAWESVVSALHGVGGVAASGLTLPTASSFAKPSSSSASAPAYANVDTMITSASSPSLVEVSDLASTRHLARVAYILSHSVDDEMSLQRVEPVTTTTIQSSHPSTTSPPPSSKTTPTSLKPHPSSQIRIGSDRCSKATRLRHPRRPSYPRSLIHLRLKPLPLVGRRRR